jgi:hypothetical protein
MDKFYINIKKDDPLAQGDIFDNLIFFNIGSEKVSQAVTDGDDVRIKELELGSYVPDGSNTIKNIIVDGIISKGIIISQNCDAFRTKYISFCQIKPLKEIDNEYNQTKKTIDYLTRKYRCKEKYFYLPMANFTEEEKMAVDFSRIYQIERTSLEKMKEKRLIRLGEFPMSHFRKKLSNYFERFAYDEWYVLDKSEFDTYKEDRKKEISGEEENLIKPYPWQA